LGEKTDKSGIAPSSPDPASRRFLYQGLRQGF